MEGMRPTPANLKEIENDIAKAEQTLLEVVSQKAPDDASLHQSARSLLCLLQLRAEGKFTQSTILQQTSSCTQPLSAPTTIITSERVADIAGQGREALLEQAGPVDELVQGCCSALTPALGPSLMVQFRAVLESLYMRQLQMRSAADGSPRSLGIREKAAERPPADESGKGECVGGGSKAASGVGKPHKPANQKAHSLAAHGRRTGRQDQSDVHCSAPCKRTASRGSAVAQAQESSTLLPDKPRVAAAGVGKHPERPSKREQVLQQRLEEVRRRTVGLSWTFHFLAGYYIP